MLPEIKNLPLSASLVPLPAARLKVWVSPASGSVAASVPTVALAVAALWLIEVLDRLTAVGASLTLTRLMVTDVVLSAAVSASSSSRSTVTV